MNSSYEGSAAGSAARASRHQLLGIADLVGGLTSGLVGAVVAVNFVIYRADSPTTAQKTGKERPS
jgi:hypothetical protein